MKKLLTLALALVLCLSLAACGGSKKETSAETETPAETEAPAETTEATVLNVASSATPHAEILEVAKQILAAKGVTLDIQVYNDYVVPNTVVDDGTVTANYFQHLPYLEDFNAQNNTHIVSVGGIHVEPMGLYGGKQTTLDAISGK